MNFFLAFLPRLLALIGPVVQSIQLIHGNAVEGATKKQLALESLGLAGAVADTVFTGNNKAIGDAAATFAGLLIDATVADKKATGAPGFTASSTATSSTSSALPSSMGSSTQATAPTH